MLYVKETRPGGGEGGDLFCILQLFVDFNFAEYLYRIFGLPV